MKSLYKIASRRTRGRGRAGRGGGREAERNEEVFPSLRERAFFHAAFRLAVPSP